MTEMHGWHHGMGMGGGTCDCGCHDQGTCPACGCGWGGRRYGKGPMKEMVFKAYRKALKHRIMAEIDRRHGDKLDATARELVDLVESKMKMKTDFKMRMAKLVDEMFMAESTESEA